MRKVFLRDMSNKEIINRLKKGEAIYEGNYDSKTFLCQGVLIRQYVSGDRLFYADIFVDADDETFYFPESDQEVLVEVGKFYKNKKGEKCFVYRQVSNVFMYVIVGKPDIFAVNKEGCCTTVSNIEQYPNGNEYDLIQEWVD